jgi:creatinine amidohydrolase
VALLRDVCVFTAKTFRAIAIANIHLDPGHIECLKAALEEAKKLGASVCWADITKKRWADLLGETFAKGDHAGAFETSLMRAAAPLWGRARAPISLAPVDGLMPALKKGAKTFAEAGGEDAYFGDPTAASAEDGEASFEALGEILSVSTMEHLGSKA